jgi:anti-sigma regulatory factor (Ser/Thr protein kinase)
MASTTLTSTTRLARAARQLHIAARAARAIAAQREQDPMRAAARTAQGGTTAITDGLIMRANPRPPVPGEAVSYADLDALPNAPYWARRLTRSSLHAWRLWPETIQTAELLVSELVTNAVKATSTGTEHLTYSALADVERISLTLRHLPGRVIAEVFDTDQRPPLLAAASTDDESGRGLMLVQALSKEWGYYFPPTGGKVVYCVLNG